ncbi:hypothetical protein [Arthrobacter sp. H14]|uniref:hypothetical protein n=1 Tax=Arthrobacter sp. H14 TaxID=1312959 RepID=UPI00047E9DD5|nr:hypothetical protein [Arthrobacter sp. H14]
MNEVDPLVQEAIADGAQSEYSRHAMLDAAFRRQEAILSLRTLGLPFRHIAARLGCSTAVVQAAVKAAEARRPATERREDRVPYELHVQLARKLKGDEESIRRIGRTNLERMRQTKRNPVAQQWIEMWSDLLNARVEDLTSGMLADTELGRELRHMSPFAGALTDDERRLAIRRAGQLASK